MIKGHIQGVKPPPPSNSKHPTKRSLQASLLITDLMVGAQPVFPVVYCKDTSQQTCTISPVSSATRQQYSELNCRHTTAALPIPPPRSISYPPTKFFGNFARAGCSFFYVQANIIFCVTYRVGGGSGVLRLFVELKVLTF